VRHGEAAHNVAFHAVGESAFEDERYRDAELTEKGIEQAKEVGQKLSSFNILAIWSSPLMRCIQTTEEIFEETSAQTIYLHDNLLERLGGNHVCNERKPKSVLEKKYKFYKLSRTIISENLSEKPVFWKERENQHSLYRRMLMLVLLLANLYNKYDETSYIVIVGHADAIGSLTGKGLENCEHLICTLEELTKG
jgi:broad specificity phosphatase PhoE